MNFNQTNPLEYTKYTFGKSIKLRREELGISLRNLAKKLQMTPAYLSDIEKGKRNVSLRVADKIAKALNVSLKDLL